MNKLVFMLFFAFVGVGAISIQKELQRQQKSNATNTAPDKRSKKTAFPEVISGVKTVWVVSYARSMSSTVMESFVYKQKSPETFALFEPCHRLDEWTGKPGETIHHDCMKDVINCNFAKFSKMRHYHNRLHRYPAEDLQFDKSRTSDYCTDADFHVFKTITVQDLSFDVVPILEENPDLHVVYMQRDPRAIYASRLLTFGPQATGKAEPTDMCKQMARNLDVQHPRLHRLEFHDIVADPNAVFGSLRAEIGMSWPHVPTQDWIRLSFNNANCKEGQMTTCRRDSKTHVQKWRHMLTPTQLALFDNDECKEFINRAKYDTEGFARLFPVPEKSTVEKYYMNFVKDKNVKTHVRERIHHMFKF